MQGLAVKTNKIGKNRGGGATIYFLFMYFAKPIHEDFFWHTFRINKVFKSSVYRLFLIHYKI